MANIAEKKNKGRQKVPLVRMEKDSNRLVTFSKRRAGLFKKISEICTLCGAKAAIIVISPGGKAFSFGHPSVDATIDRFLCVEPSHSKFNNNSFQAQAIETQENDQCILRYNIKLTCVRDRFESEKKRYEVFIVDRKLRNDDFEWISHAQEFVVDNLDKAKGMIIPLKKTLSHLYHEFVTPINNNASKPIYQSSQGMIENQSPPYAPLNGSNASKYACQFSQGMVGGQSSRSTLFDGPNASSFAYQSSQDMVGSQKISSTLFEGQNALKQPYQFSQGMVEGQSPPTSLFYGSNASKPSYQSSQDMIGGQNLPSTLFDGYPQSHQITTMAPPNLNENHTNHQITTMVPTNFVGGLSNSDQSQIQSQQTAAQVPPNFVGGHGNNQIMTMAPSNFVGGLGNYEQPQPQLQFQSQQMTTMASPSLVGGPNDHQMGTMTPNNFFGGPNNYIQPQPRFQPQFQSHQIGAMVPPNLTEVPSNHQIGAMVPANLTGVPSNNQIGTMAPTNIFGGFGDMTIDNHLNVSDNVNANATRNDVIVNPLPSLPNPTTFDFPSQNLLPSFQGDQNPNAEQFNGLPPLPSMDMDMDISPMPFNFQMNPMPINFDNFSSSSQVEMNNMINPTSSYNLQNGSGFGNNGFGYGNNGSGFGNNGFGYGNNGSGFGNNGFY